MLVQSNPIQIRKEQTDFWAKAPLVVLWVDHPSSPTPFVDYKEKDKYIHIQNRNTDTVSSASNVVAMPDERATVRSGLHRIRQPQWWNAVPVTKGDR